VPSEAQRLLLSYLRWSTEHGTRREAWPARGSRAGSDAEPADRARDLASVVTAAYREGRGRRPIGRVGPLEASTPVVRCPHQSEAGVSRSRRPLGGRTGRPDLPTWNRWNDDAIRGRAPTGHGAARQAYQTTVDVLSAWVRSSTSPRALPTPNRMHRPTTQASGNASRSQNASHLTDSPDRRRYPVHSRQRRPNAASPAGRAAPNALSTTYGHVRLVRRCPGRRWWRPARARSHAGIDAGAFGLTRGRRREQRSRPAPRAARAPGSGSAR
jgi:hypothetical protein